MWQISCGLAPSESLRKHYDELADQFRAKLNEVGQIRDAIGHTRKELVKNRGTTGHQNQFSCRSPKTLDTDTLPCYE